MAFLTLQSQVISKFGSFNPLDRISTSLILVLRNNVILDTVDLEMPPFERSTTGFWIDLPKATLDILRQKGINAAEAIHSAAHAFLNRFPMAADVRTECKVPVKEYLAAGSKRKRPARCVIPKTASSATLFDIFLCRLIFFDSAGTDGAIAAKAFDHGMGVDNC